MENTGLTDTLMDICLLAAVQLCFSKLHVRRLLVGQLLLGLCTLAVLATNAEPTQIQLLNLPVFLLAAAIATGERRPARVVQAGLCLYCAAAAAAGFSLMFGSMLPAATAGLVAAGFLLRRSTHVRFRWNVEVHVEATGVSCSFPALIDTGNRLREHRSGLPVLIVEATAVPVFQAMLENMDAGEIRTLPYGVLGSCGELRCFRPDKVHMQLPGRGEIPAPECYLAIYPGRIPGPTQALAPPEFLDALQYQDTFFIKIMHRLRRFGQYVVFKRKAVHLRFGGSDATRIGLLHRRQRPASPAPDPRGGG